MGTIIDTSALASTLVRPASELIPSITLPKTNMALGVFRAQWQEVPFRTGVKMFETPSVKVDAGGHVFRPVWKEIEIVTCDEVSSFSYEAARIREQLADRGEDGLVRFCSYEKDEQGGLVARVTGHMVGQGEMPKRFLYEVASQKTPGTIATELMLCWVPCGDFLYGDEKIRKTLPAYFIAMTPTTVGQYKAFVDDSGYAETDPKWMNPGFEHGVVQTEDHPVVYVNWHNCVAMCDWAGVRLPSVEETEKAIRGVNGNKYPWGDTPPEEDLLHWSGPGSTSAPIQKHGTASVYDHPNGRSPFGLNDAAGNVWVWTCTP